MKTRYFIGAAGLHGVAEIARFVDVESFDEALQTLQNEAQQHFGARPYRITAVSEQPDHGLSGPISILLELAKGKS